MGLQIGSTAKVSTKTVRNESYKFFKSNEQLAGCAKEFRTNLNRYLSSVAARNTAETPENEIAKAKLETVGRLARAQFDKAYPEEIVGKKAEQLEQELIEHLNSEKVGIDDEFQVDATEVNKDKQIKYTDKDFALTLNKRDLSCGEESSFQYIEATDSTDSYLILRELPEKLDKEIREHLELEKE